MYKIIIEQNRKCAKEKRTNARTKVFQNSKHIRSAIGDDEQRAVGGKVGVDSGDAVANGACINDNDASADTATHRKSVDERHSQVVAAPPGATRRVLRRTFRD